MKYLRQLIYVFKKAYFCSLFWVSVMILLPGNCDGAGAEHVVESGCSQGEREEHEAPPLILVLATLLVLTGAA